jgi:hypothetical protein
VEDNKAVWKYQFTFEVAIPVSKDNMMLEDCFLRFSVKRERTEGFVKIGQAKVNLSEFACTRTMEKKRKMVKLLLQNSLVNSALNVSIGMKQVAGSPFFKAPLPKTSRLHSANVPQEDDIDSSTSALMLLKNIENPESALLRRGSSQSGSDDEIKEPIKKSKLDSSDMFGLLGDSMVVDAVQEHYEKSPMMAAMSAPANQVSPMISPLTSPKNTYNAEDTTDRPRRNMSIESAAQSLEVPSSGSAYHFTNFEIAQQSQSENTGEKKTNSNPSSSRKLELLMLIDEVMDESSRKKSTEKKSIH